jgi:hypothetical protein
MKRLAEHLARATDDVTDEIAASLEAFATEEAAEYREEAVLSCSSSTEAVSLSVLRGFLLLSVGGRPHGIHLHRAPGLFSGRLRLVLHIDRGGLKRGLGEQGGGGGRQQISIV